MLYISDAPIVNLSCPGRNEDNEGNNFTCECRGVGGNPPPTFINIQINFIFYLECLLPSRHQSYFQAAIRSCPVSRSTSLLQQSFRKGKVYIFVNYNNVFPTVMYL